MRVVVLLALSACGVSWAGSEPAAHAGAFEQMKSLAGEWQAATRSSTSGSQDGRSREPRRPLRATRALG